MLRRKPAAALDALHIQVWRFDCGQRPDSGQHRRVAGVEEDVQRMGSEVGHVGRGELFESADQVLRPAGGRGTIGVGPVFMLAGEAVDRDSEDQGNGREEKAEKDEARIDLGVRLAKGSK